MPDPRIWPIPAANDTFVSVGVASTEVRPANPRRVSLDLVNDGDNIIYLALGNTAVVGSGIRLNKKGGSYHIGTNNLFLGQINGIAEDETNLTISEGYKPE